MNNLAYLAPSTAVTEFSTMFDGREYNAELTKEEGMLASMAGVVVVFGASDDLIEFRGAIHNEFDCYKGGRFSFTSEGKFPTDEELETLDKFRARPAMHTITAEWAPDGTDLSWRFSTDLPHATFLINEDGAPFCEGIVFDLDALRRAAGQPPAVDATKPVQPYGDVGQTISSGLTEEQEGDIDQLRIDIQRLSERVARLPPHRSVSLAITKLDEAGHWLRDRLGRHPSL